MRALVQRVAHAQVEVDGRVTGRIGDGLLVFVGATHADGEPEARWMAAKLATLRVFADAEGRMNHSLADTGGGALMVPQFTLYGDARQGRRPEFTAAARPEVAEPLFERVCALLAESGTRVERGVFRAHMQVTLLNDGPVTLMLETPARADA